MQQPQQPTFFERVINPTPPKDPLEGMFKLFLLSQIITTSMDLAMNAPNPATSQRIINIYIAALFFGFLWGLINQIRIKRGLEPVPTQEFVEQVGQHLGFGGR